MNSKRNVQARTVKTNCRNCVFAEYDGITQTGCKAGRISTFKSMDVVTEARDETKEFYVIDKLCNYFRDDSWKYEGEPLEAAHKECTPSFAVMIYNLVDSSHKSVIAQLDALLDYDMLTEVNPRIVVSMYHSVVDDTTQVISRIDQLNAKGVYAKLVVNKAGLAREGVDFAAFKHVAECHYAIKLDEESVFDKMVFSDIDESLNENLESIAFFDYGKGMSAIPMNIIKQQYLHYRDYHKLEADLKMATIVQKSYKNME